MTEKHKRICKDMMKITKTYFCEHSVELVVKHKQLFSRCVKCGAMWKMKEGKVNGKL